MLLTFTVNCPHCFKETVLSSKLSYEETSINIEKLEYILPYNVMCDNCGRGFSLEIDINVNEDDICEWI